MKIIVNLICLDSEPELPALLASLEGKVDAVVAVDGGSTDKTVEILKAWGEEKKIPVDIKINPWPDDFAEQRNLCLDVTRVVHGVATQNEDIWVLMIDTDDTLVHFDHTFVKAISERREVNALLCKMDNGNGFFTCVQFFRLSRDVHWENPIHEFVCFKQPRGMPPDGTLTIKRGRSARHDRDPERNIRIGRRFVEAVPNDNRARFYLARDLLECEAIPVQQRNAEAEGHLRAYLTMKTNFVTQDRYALLLLVRLLCDTNRTIEARTLLTDWIKKDPDNRSAYEALSRMSSSEDEAGVWHRLAAAAEGSCVLPYGSKLPRAMWQPQAKKTE